MLCDGCGKNPATVHLTEIINDQMNELHLCEECARKKSQDAEQNFGLGDLLGGMADINKTEKDKETATLKCPNCGLTYADFKKIGRLGCGDCYNAFKKYLAPLLKRIHGSSQHVGKSPTLMKSSAKALKKNTDIQELRDKLQRAVEQEQFEEAARLRDQIKKLEVKGPEDGQAEKRS
jgi:protein arginine kinase activator